jgi:hypothetical protein
VAAFQPGRGDADLLLLAGGLVARAHVDNTVRVDIERDFDLRYARLGRRNARQLQQMSSVDRTIKWRGGGKKSQGENGDTNSP